MQAAQGLDLMEGVRIGLDPHRPPPPNYDPRRFYVELPAGLPLVVAGKPLHVRRREEPSAEGLTVVVEEAFSDCGCGARRSVVAVVGNRAAVEQGEWIAWLCEAHAAARPWDRPDRGLLRMFGEQELQAELADRQRERGERP